MNDEHASEASEPRWVDVSIAGVRRAAGDDAYRKAFIVILEEVTGTRALPIGVQSTDGTSLAMILQNVETRRPMTHQFAASLVEASGAHVSEVRITRCAEGTFYAAVVVDGPSGRREMDARPSDSLCLASIVRAPIRVDERVLAAQAADGFTDTPDYPTTETELANEVRHALAGRSG
ncbi:bifunctional nuclease family protein [Actinopolymorpha pittospori]